MQQSIMFADAVLVDGTGGPRRPADVLVAGGRILEVGRDLHNNADVTVNADGRVLCPGFIDMHSHADFTLGENHGAFNLAAQGITLVLGGNCGSSTAPARGDMADPDRLPGRTPWAGPMDEWFAHLQERGTGINVAMLAGHGTVRGGVMGMDATRPADSAEIQAMRKMMTECLRAGAYGISTGRDYVPGCYAEAEEIAAAARDLTCREGVFYASHLKDEAWGLLPSVREALDIGAELEVPVQLSHHKAMIPDNWGTVTHSLALVDERVASGEDVRLDVYPYTFAAAKDLFSLFPPWFTSDGRKETVRRMREREDFDRLRRDLRHGYPGWHSEIAAFRWGYTVLKSRRRPDWQGHTIGDLAGAAGEDPTEILRDLAISDGGDTVCAFTMCKKDVRTIMRHPRASICTDAPAIDDPSTSSHPIHPRAYGAYPRLLGRYVRDEGVLELEEAVYKCTGLPASWLSLTDRGIIREDAIADIVLFDPDRVADRASLDDPSASPCGIDWVLVNGSPVIREGEPTGSRPGDVVRRIG